MKYGLEGYFTLVVIDSSGIKSRSYGPFRNRITNIGLNRLATGSVFSGACVGIGNNPPADTDTSLQSQVASTSSRQSQTDIVGPNVAPYYTAQVNTYRFSEGAAAGNLSEVGIYFQSSGTLWSRSLILDSSGSPTTITVLPNEVLDVVYECRIYAMDDDTTGGPINLLGVDYNWTMRALDVRTAMTHIFAVGITGDGYWGATNGNLSPVTSNYPSGADAGSSNRLTAAAYENNSFKRRMSLNWGIADGNAAGGIKSIYGGITGAGTTVKFQIGLDKLFPKSNTNTFDLSFEVSWGRRAI